MKRTLGHFPNLTIRALVLSGVGSLIITASSMYVALRMSALPWPTVFVSILSLAVLRLLGGTNVSEINIAQTGMSAGAMVAGALAFTLPGLWISGIFEAYDPAKGTLREWLMPKFGPILAVTFCGALLGSLLCFFLRRFYLKKQELAYPIGLAAAQTLSAAESGRGQGKWLFSALGASSVLTILRDAPAMLGGGKGLIPGTIVLRQKTLPLSLELSPMAFGIGYLIGFGPTVYWFAGALLSHWVFRVYGLSSGAFASAEAIGEFVLTAAIGLMVGSGIGILFQFVRNIVQARRQRMSRMREAGTAKRYSGKRILIFGLSLIAAYVLASFAGFGFFQTALLLIGVLFATAMSATITGQTGINPMEIFAIIILLAIRAIVNVGPLEAFLMTGAIAVACGFAGDLMNDYKMGDVLKTDPHSQFVSQIVGGLIGCFVAVIGLFAIIYQYGGVGGTSGLTAVQAHTVSAMVQGMNQPFVFFVSLFIGCLFYLNGVPSMIIGIGMLLPLSLSVTVFAGGLLSLIISKTTKSEQSAAERMPATLKLQLIAAGCLGGEGLTGTILAIVAMIRG